MTRGRQSRQIVRDTSGERPFVAGPDRLFWT